MRAEVKGKGRDVDGVEKENRDNGKSIGFSEAIGSTPAVSSTAHDGGSLIAGGSKRSADTSPFRMDVDKEGVVTTGTGQPTVEGTGRDGDVESVSIAGSDGTVSSGISQERRSVVLHERPSDGDDDGEQPSVQRRRLDVEVEGEEGRLKRGGGARGRQSGRGRR